MAPPGKITNYKIQITNKEMSFGQGLKAYRGPIAASSSCKLQQKIF
jgi:hypothetical protein